MLPVASVMIERGHAEKMIVALRREIDRCKFEANINRGFIDAALNFIHIYADKCASQYPNV